MKRRGGRIIAVSSLCLCPVELEACARVECRSAYCAGSGEPLLRPCSECGALIAVRRSAVCAGCLERMRSASGED